MSPTFTDLVTLLTRGNTEIHTALIVDGQGRVFASERLSRAAVALVVPLREFIDRATAELGCGALRDTLVEGDQGTFALADIDGDRTAVIVGQPGAAAGALRADSLWLAEQVRGLPAEVR
jgi:predicted regulator of Ras-like GTPase activity (Roadblock/LC7/MglB family)